MTDRQLALSIACLMAFLLGSIPFGVIVARSRGMKDLSERGSGNIGATNVARLLGFWPAGVITLILDMLKGMLAVLLATPTGALVWTGILGVSGFDPGEGFPWVTAFFAVAGHCYTPWLKLKGGKGVATAFGALCVLSPWAALAGVAAFGLAFWLKRIGSLASLSGLLLASLAHLVLNPVGPYLWAGGAMVLLVLIRHESNIDALLENREKAF